MTILKKVGLNAVLLVQLLLSVLKPGIFNQLLFDKYVFFLFFIGFSKFACTTNRTSLPLNQGVVKFVPKS